MEKNGKLNFYCKKCNYTTHKEYNYKRHIKSDRHNDIETKKYKCDFCYKSYKTLWGKRKHEKKCSENKSENEVILLNDTIIKKEPETVAQEKFNQKMIETMKTMTEEIKNLKTTNIVNNNCNQTNISINLFLNEYCSNAMNLNDFVEKIKYTFEDVMKIYNSGYSQGLSNVVIKQLKDMSALDRPIHCTDQKRGTLYIKNNEKWTKKNINTIAETESMICKLRKKQYLALSEWEAKNPNWIDCEKLTTMRHDLVSKLIGGSDEKNLMKQHKDVLLII